MMGGVCRVACGNGEAAESGAFDDCGEKQDCCVVHDAAKDRINCCIYSFDVRNYDKPNCGAPENSKCLKGSGSPSRCEQLAACKKP